MTKSNVVYEATRGLLLVVGAFAASCAAGGYRDDDNGGGTAVDYFRGHEPSGGGGGGGRQQLPVILMHKQALQEDGGFQYAFAADNGLRQGESIRPDGSRTGAYSYTDPDGKEITVRYTAGKDGFRIVQGDHVPRAPVSVQPLLQQPPPSVGRSVAGTGKNRLFGAPGGPGSQFSRGGPYDSEEAYKPKYSKQQQHYRVREDEDGGGELPSRYDDDGPHSAFDGTGDYSSHSPFRAPPASPAQASDSKEQQPHTFGGGYAFEFGGGGGGGGGDGATAEF